MALLSLCDVSKTYWRGRHPIRVLDRVSLDVEPGQFVAVNASARAGKTTLLRVAAGLERPDEGAVLFDGRDLALPRSRRWWSPSPHVRALHPRMAWVRRAGPSSKSTPMLRYVALALLDEYRAREADRRASALLQELGVDDLARATWRELSDSERTLMTIAHAIARRPALLFADNLTDGLGLNERETVLALLRHRVESAGMAILLAAETVPATLRADTITTLSNGQLIKPTQPPAADVVPLRRDAR